MTRLMMIVLAVCALSLGTAACGKKGDPRLARGSDGYPAGYPAGAPVTPDNIFRKPGPE